MKTILITLINIALFSSVYCQQSEYIYSNFDLNSQAKLVYQTCYTAKEKKDTIVRGKLVDKYHRKTDYAVSKRPVKYVFNKKGYITLKEDYFKNDYSKLSYQYNDENQIIELTEYYKLNNDYIIKGKVITEHESDTVLVKWCYSDTSTFVKYYKNELLIKTVGEFPDGNYKIKYEYDTNNNEVLQQYIYPDGSTYEWHTIFEYDQEGNIVKKIVEEGEGFVKNIYEYFPNGMLQYKINDNTYEYKYVYDTHGNWTIKIEYVNGHASNIYERYIEYY